MQYRSLGKSGLRVSAIGLGCNNLGGRIDEPQSRAVVHRALDEGIRFFDVADVYGRRDAHAGASEETLGRILGARRNDIILATKFGMPMDESGLRQGASAAYISRAVEDSLRRLRTDRIDLYQLHRPDPLTPIDETLRALDLLIRAGKVRYIGCSNLPAWQVVDASHVASQRGFAGFVSCQDELSLLARQNERELLPAMAHFGMGLLPYFPLASGLLSGKYRRDHSLPAGSRFEAWPHLQAQYLTPKNWRIIEKLHEISQQSGMTMIDLAFGWLLAKPTVSCVIAGATTPEQVSINCRAGSASAVSDALRAIDAVILEEPA